MFYPNMVKFLFFILKITLFNNKLEQVKLLSIYGKLLNIYGKVNKVKTKSLEVVEPSEPIRKFDFKPTQTIFLIKRKKKKIKKKIINNK